jgi:hypothetical protein
MRMAFFALVALLWGVTASTGQTTACRQRCATVSDALERTQCLVDCDAAADQKPRTGKKKSKAKKANIPARE